MSIYLAIRPHPVDLFVHSNQQKIHTKLDHASKFTLTSV